MANIRLTPEREAKLELLMQSWKYSTKAQVWDRLIDTAEHYEAKKKTEIEALEDKLRLLKTL